MQSLWSISAMILATNILVYGKDPVCYYNSKAGATFDLRPMMKSLSSDQAYYIKDGDIPCTPEIEPSFNYIWNFCSNVPGAVLPSECKDQGKTGVLLQYVTYDPTLKFCYIVGHYDPQIDQLTYNLLDQTDPSKGVSITYPAGEKCATSTQLPRQGTIDIMCANQDSTVLTAQEPASCSYHMTMKSWYGCPTQCPITKNGLCDSHGLCKYDKTAKQAYCYCNDGYSGSSCSTYSSGSESYDGFSVQLGLLITLLIVVIALAGGMVYLAIKIGDFRKQQISSHYRNLPGGESELVETVSFR